MGGTAAGGRAARDKNLANDPEHYRKIGRMGGRASRTGGFYGNRALASKAGKIGGAVSRRRPAKRYRETV
jgi:general stress protein YciG